MAGKYRVFGTMFDRVFRNNLNANFDDIDTDIKAVDTRVSNIVASAGNTNTEIVDARGGKPVLKDRLDGFDSSLAERASLIKNDTRELNTIINEKINDSSTFILKDSLFLNTVTITLPVGKKILIIDNSDYDSFVFNLPLNTSATVIKAKDGTTRSYFGGNATDGTVKTLDNSFEFANRNYNLENVTKNADDFDLPSGYYRVLDKTTYQGTLPDSFGILIVYRINNTIINQMFLKDSLVYLRSYATNTWSTWIKVNQHVETISTASATLNDKINAGVYVFTNTITNVPNGINGTNHMLTVSTNGTYVVQKLTSMRNAVDKFPTDFTRFSKDKGVTWTPWRSSHEGDWTICYQKDVDFNTVTEKGSYRVNTFSNTATNAPATGYTKIGVLEVVGADNYVVQRLTQNDGTKFSRFYNGSTWTAWV